MAAASTGCSPEIGFLGLGTMGGPMVHNLLCAGYTVVAFDIKPERLAACLELGAEAGENEADVVGRGGMVLTSLPSSQVFVEVAETHLLPNARAEQVFVDLGTTAPWEARRLAAAFIGKGACLLDVPVSGGSLGAQQGTLRMFAGGDRSAVERCRPVLEVLGDPSRIVYCGPSGAGQVVKGVNQLAMGLGDAAYLEAIAFGVRTGVDPAAIRTAVGGPEGWRAHFEAIAGRVTDGEGENVFIKFPELPYFLGEARERPFEMPLTQALYDFTRAGERKWVDNMDRPRPSFWHELISTTMKGRPDQ